MAERARPGRSKIRLVGGLGSPWAAKSGCIAAPEDGRAPVAVSRCARLDCTPTKGACCYLTTYQDTTRFTPLDTPSACTTLENECKNVFCPASSTTELLYFSPRIPGVRPVALHRSRLSNRVLNRIRNHSHLGRPRSPLPLFRYLAACHQYRDDNYNLPDGVLDSKHPKPRHQSAPSKVG